MSKLKLEYVKDIKAIHFAGEYFSLWVCMAWRLKGYIGGHTPLLQRIIIPIPFTKWGIHVTLFRYHRDVRVKGA